MNSYGMDLIPLQKNLPPGYLDRYKKKTFFKIINMSIRNYHCTQRELYAVCASGWKNCMQNLERFSAFRPIYTPELIETRLNEIATVRSMAHKSSRAADQGFARIELKNKLSECLTVWKKLRMTIPEIWPAEQHKMHYQAMGEEFLAGSRKMKWEACTGLMDTLVSYVQQHADILQSNPLLGPEFLNEVRTLASDLNILLDKYLLSMKESGKGAEAKENASNLLFKNLKYMFADAHLIFKNEPEMLRDFSFDAQLDLVSGSSGSGIKGTISAGKVPVNTIPELLLVLSENGDEAYITDDGNYRFSQLAAGSYTIQVSAQGYKDQVIKDINVNTGSFTMQHIKLEPVDPSTEPEEKIS
jgi:hypothetical protein